MLFPNLIYDEIEFDMEKGDRLFLYSDGVTECSNRNMDQFSLERFMNHISGTGKRGLKQALELISSDLEEWRDLDQLEDDISILALEMV